MVSREILNSHPISTLKKEIGKVNIRNYSKLTKTQLVELMMKYKERFGHIKMADKKARAPRAAKPKKEEKPKIPQPPPAPAPKAGSPASGNLGADIKKTARQKAQDRTVKRSKAMRAATAAAKEGRARTAQRSQVSDFLGQIGGSGKSEAVKKTAGEKLELAGGKPPKKEKKPKKKKEAKTSKVDKSFAASKKLTGLTREQLNKLDPAELFGLLPKTARKTVLDPKTTGTQVAKPDWRDAKMSEKDEKLLKLLKEYFKKNGDPTGYSNLKILDGKLYVDIEKHHDGSGSDEVGYKDGGYWPSQWKSLVDRPADDPHFGTGASGYYAQEFKYNPLKNLKEGEMLVAKKRKIKGTSEVPTFIDKVAFKTHGVTKTVRGVRYAHGDYQKKGKNVYDPYGQKDWGFVKPADYRKLVYVANTEDLKKRADRKEIELYSMGKGADKYTSRVMLYDAKKNEFRELGDKI